MDTSETYIKMCEKAEEIQECYDMAKYPYPNLFWYNNELHFLNNLKVGIWLPRQDQLQEMIGKTYPEPYFMLTDWIIENESKIDENMNNPCFANTESMEQLWLAFVMKEKYNKIWNGEDWINE